MVLSELQFSSVHFLAVLEVAESTIHISSDKDLVQLL